MTKAFSVHGLPFAGLQDRQEGSAKRPEEVTQDTGASLVGVPMRPPPPQMGLLGAVSAHERERKREGGLGPVAPDSPGGATTTSVVESGTSSALPPPFFH